MSTTHKEYNNDSFSSGIENIVTQTQWSIHFSHVPTKKCVFFEAFLTDFQDGFRSSWSKESVYGRMDPIATFQNTERTISFAFDVVAESAIAAENNVHRFQHLSSFLYPTYEELQSPNSFVESSGKLLTMNQSPLIRIKFANLIHDAQAMKGGSRSKGISSPASQTPNPNVAGLVGYVQGFDFSPKLENGFFCGGPGIFYPMEYSVNVDFSVLHNHDLGWDQSGTWLGPNSFPNGDGTRGLSEVLPKECIPKEERITIPSDQESVGTTGESAEGSVKGKQDAARTARLTEGRG